MSSRLARPGHCASGTFPADASSRVVPPTWGARHTPRAWEGAAATEPDSNPVRMAPKPLLRLGPAGGATTESPPIEARAVERVRARGASANNPT